MSAAAAARSGGGKAAWQRVSGSIMKMAAIISEK